MLRIEEFCTGQVSIPAPDADDVPSCCFTCAYLSYKEFSVGDGLYYYFCGYNWHEGITLNVPPCLKGPKSGVE
jgi:hypothetical protein